MELEADRADMFESSVNPEGIQTGEELYRL